MSAAALELPLGDVEPSNKTTDKDFRFDWMNAFCCEKYGAPQNWRWLSGSMQRGLGNERRDA